METPLDIYRLLAEEAGPVVLATVVSVQGSTPGKPGFKMLVYPDGRRRGTVGGGTLEENVLTAAQEALAGGVPVLQSYSLTQDGLGMWCGGEATVLLEPIMPAATLWVFGYGNLGREVCELLGGLPFRTIVIDDDEDPPATGSVRIDWEALTPFPEVGTGDYVLLLTMDPEREVEIIARLADRKPRYVGVIGSKTKAAKLRNALAERGVSVEELNLHCPVGLPIGAKTAREIAISIAGELIRESNAP